MTPSGNILASWQEYDITVVRSLLPLTTYAALINNSVVEGGCFAQWRFETAALLDDSKGSNDFTQVAANYASNLDYKEGATSIEHVRGGSAYSIRLVDSNLSTGFPLKNGEVNASISLCFWLKVIQWNSSNGSCSIFWKGATGKFSFEVNAWQSGSNVYFTLRVGNTGGANWSVYTFGTTLSLSQWYHIGVTCDLTSYRIRIWDDAAIDLLAADKTGANLEMPITDADIDMWANGAFGDPTTFRVDNMVLFNRVLAVSEIDLIRAEHASS